jgi:hypothetical protein
VGRASALRKGKKGEEGRERKRERREWKGEEKGEEKRKKEGGEEKRGGRGGKEKQREREREREREKERRKIKREKGGEEIQLGPVYRNGSRVQGARVREDGGWCLCAVGRVGGWRWGCACSRREGAGGAWSWCGAGEEGVYVGTFSIGLQMQLGNRAG